MTWPLHLISPGSPPPTWLHPYGKTCSSQKSQHFPASFLCIHYRAWQATALPPPPPAWCSLSFKMQLRHQFLLWIHSYSSQVRAQCLSALPGALVLPYCDTLYFNQFKFLFFPLHSQPPQAKNLHVFFCKSQNFAQYLAHGLKTWKFNECTYENVCHTS